MTTAIEVAKQGGFDLESIPEFQRYADHIARTDFVPAAMRNNGPAVLACIMTGQELGILPMQALRQIYNFDGKIGLFSELMRALVLKHGHRLYFGEGAEYTTTRVVCYGVRADNGDTSRVEWTIDMAKAAGLTNKNNWKMTPRAMLAARASTEVCRNLFPDVVAGMAYSAEELQDGVYDDDTVVEAEIVGDAPTSQKRTAPAPRKRTAKKAAPKPAPAPVEDVEPTLPDDEIQDAEIVEEPPAPKPPKDDQTPEQKSRSVQIVRMAKAMNMDHHPHVNAATRGATSSARMLTQEQADEVMDSLRAVNDGRAKIQDRGDGVFAVFAIDYDGSGNGIAPDPDVEIPDDEIQPEDDDVVEAEIVDDDDELEDEEEDDPETWDADRWRGYLAAKGVKVISVVRYAAGLTSQGTTPPGNLQSIAGSGLAGQIKNWIDGQ